MINRTFKATFATLVLVALALGAPALARPPLEEGAFIEISADRSALSTSDDVFVTFTVRNEGSRPLAIYVWDTPLSGEVENDLFSVTRDGLAVPYLGIVAKRAAPTAEDFVHLAPGHSRSVRVELSALYDMSQPGDYVVQYRAASPAMAARLGGDGASNLVGVRLDGEARRSPLPLAAPTALSPTTTYSDCSNTQIAVLEQALPAARSYASSASSSLTGSAGARYTTWFGTYTSARYGTVKNHYSAISSALSTESYNFDCKCKKNYYAYVYPTKPYTVYLCKVFWTAPLTGTDSQGGTLIHETSHFNTTASTNDWVYGQSGCKSLAQSDPDKAIDNADSHEYYAENNP